MLDHSTIPKPASLFNSWRDKQIFLDSCKESVEKFQDNMRGHVFQTSGTFYAESYAFLKLCDMFNIDIILESGMSRGNSTEIWARNFHKKIITFENAKQPYHDQVVERLSAYENIEINFRDSNSGFIEKIESYPDSNIAIFIDGPKDFEAVSLAMKSFNFKNVLFAGIHDVANPITKCRENYGFMKSFKLHLLSTDEPEYSDMFSYLDQSINDPNGAWIYNKDGVSAHSPDPKAIVERFPRGPGIGIALNHNVYS